MLRECARTPRADLTDSHVNIRPHMSASPSSPPARRRYGGVGPEERQQQRRARLIEAGIAVFGARGYHATTVREICAESRLTERYFYESFRSLPALFAAVYSELIRDLKTQTLSVLATTPPDPDRMAEAALRVFYEYIRVDPRRARICLIDAISIGPDMLRLGLETTKEYASLVRAFLGLLYTENLVTDVDLDLLSAGLIGMNIHIATEWVSGGCTTPMETVIATNLSAYKALNQAFSAVRREPGAADAPRKLP